MKKGSSMSPELRKKLSLMKKGVKRTGKERLAIIQGRNNSPKWQAHLERCRVAREPKEMTKAERRRKRDAEREAKRLEREMARVAFIALKNGRHHTPEGLRRIS